MRLSSPWVAYIKDLEKSEQGWYLNFAFPRSEKRTMRGGDNQYLTDAHVAGLLKALNVTDVNAAFHKPILVIKDRKDKSITGKPFIWDETMIANDPRISVAQRAYHMSTEWDLPKATEPVVSLS